MQTVNSTNHDTLIALATQGPVALVQGGQEIAYVLSRQDYDRLSRKNIAAFNSICEIIGKEAQMRGLTEEKLAQLLADES